jgi:hypothetical protein
MPRLRVDRLGDVGEAQIAAQVEPHLADLLPDGGGALAGWRRRSCRMAAALLPLIAGENA